MITNSLIKLELSNKPGKTTEYQTDLNLTFADITDLKYFSGQQHNTIVRECISEPDHPQNYCMQSMLFRKQIRKSSWPHLAAPDFN